MSSSRRPLLRRWFGARPDLQRAASAAGARARHSRGRAHGAALGGRRQHEVGGRDRANFDLKIDPVEQRARNACLIVRGAARAPAAGLTRTAATTARVHRSYELNARRIGDAMVGARDHGFARLERLTERIEGLRGELRSYAASSPNFILKIT